MIFRAFIFCLAVLVAVPDLHAQILPHPSLNGRTVTEIFNSLIAAGTDSSKMAGFFTDWNRRSGPDSRHVVARNRKVKAVHDVFRVIFRPYDLASLDFGSNPSNIPNYNPRFVAVQQQIRYAVLQDAEFTWSDSVRTTDTLYNFRPAVNVYKSKVLYLTDEYKLAIDSFLGIVPRIHLKQMLSTRSRETFDTMFSRSGNLARFIPVHYRISFVKVISAPYVEYMILNRSLNKALVIYSFGGGGTRGFMEKKGRKWKLMRIEVAWYE